MVIPTRRTRSRLAGQQSVSTKFSSTESTSVAVESESEAETNYLLDQDTNVRVQYAKAEVSNDNVSSNHRYRCYVQIPNTKIEQHNDNLLSNGDKDSDVDDPDPVVNDVVSEPATTHSTSTRKAKRHCPGELTGMESQKQLHRCIIWKVSVLPNNSASGPCSSRHPKQMAAKDIVLHYYLHYRQAGMWDDVVPPAPCVTTTSQSSVESYQCKMCDHKFKVKRGDESEHARTSFLYHYATTHGKLIDAMQQERHVDLTPVLRLLSKHCPNIRPFIVDGTDKQFDTEPCIIRYHPDYKALSMQTANATQQKDRQTSTAVPFRRQVSISGLDTGRIQCPHCNQLDDNRDVNKLKLHLFHHYMDYWADLVPRMASNQAKCPLCNKRLTADNPNALRISVICHRALAHEELRMAVEDDEITDFDQDLFDKLFNETIPPRRVISSKKKKSTSLCADTTKLSTNDKRMETTNVLSKVSSSQNKDSSGPAIVFSSDESDSELSSIVTVRVMKTETCGEIEYEETTFVDTSSGGNMIIANQFETKVNPLSGITEIEENISHNQPNTVKRERPTFADLDENDEWKKTDKRIKMETPNSDVQLSFAELVPSESEDSNSQW